MSIFDVFAKQTELYNRWLEALPEKDRENWERDASVLDGFRKKDELCNRWVALLTGKEKEDWERDRKEDSRQASDWYAGRAPRIDKFVEDLCNAPINTPVVDIPGLLDGMDTTEMIKGVKRFLNALNRNKTEGKTPVKDCYAEAYSAVMAENGGKKPKQKAVLCKLAELADNADRAGDFSYPLEAADVDPAGNEINADGVRHFGTSAIGKWHTELNKKNFPT